MARQLVRSSSKFRHALPCALAVAWGLAATFSGATPASAEASPTPREPAEICRNFVPNPGVAVDSITSKSDFLPCSGFSYALCYYSGPQPMECTLDEGGETAACQCYLIDQAGEPAHGAVADAADGAFYIDKTSILNRCIAEQTEAYCKYNDCSVTNRAPVCWYALNRPDLFAPAGSDVDVISTFSTATVEGASLGCTNCSGAYAGCMTAPCKTTKNAAGEDIALCQCPMADGTFQVGQDNQSCEISPTEDGQTRVWSAAANSKGKCAPTPGP
ncbi:MAG: hypothetical protein AAFY88_18480 [Acidobacteriota bacterium]